MQLHIIFIIITCATEYDLVGKMKQTCTNQHTKRKTLAIVACPLGIVHRLELEYSRIGQSHTIIDLP